MANRDIADYHLGEGAGAHMSLEDVRQVEQHRDGLKARLKELGIDTAE
jgi:hypothetical protein